MVRRRRSEDGGQRTEVRGRRSEDRYQKWVELVSLVSLVRENVKGLIINKGEKDGCRKCAIIR